MPMVAIILLLKSNKFFVKPKSNKVLTGPSSIKGFNDGQGTGGISRKANKEILEHDRKRQIELKLIVLEDKLVDQGYTDAEIADKLQEARQMLEASAASEEAGGPTAIIVGDEKRLMSTWVTLMVRWCCIPKAVILFQFLLVEAPGLMLNPPFSLSNSDRLRLRHYIDILSNRQNFSRSERMALLKSEMVVVPGETVGTHRQ